MFGLMSMLYGVLFVLNSVVILDEKRFLSRIGLPLAPECRGSLGPGRRKVVDLLRAIRTVMRIPLIILNVMCIVYEVVLG